MQIQAQRTIVAYYYGHPVLSLARRDISLGINLYKSSYNIYITLTCIYFEHIICAAGKEKTYNLCPMCTETYWYIWGLSQIFFYLTQKENKLSTLRFKNFLKKKTEKKIWNEKSNGYNYKRNTCILKWNPNLVLRENTNREKN